MRSPVLTLLTDFGLADHYVGVMKGVILKICPRATIVDISHDVVPFEITQGAFLLLQAYKYFPRGTVHVAVVDPGVGSTRRPILVECEGQFFIGPDNGLLAPIHAINKSRVRHITAEKYYLHPVSRTFHGRDIFAPVAAHLASGVRPSAFGKPIDDYLRPHTWEPIRTAKSSWTGTILHVDRFGNLVTNFTTREFPDLSLKSSVLQIGTREITTFVHSYAEANTGEVFVIAGSSNFYEVSVNQGSAARYLGCGVGSPCELSVR